MSCFEGIHGHGTGMASGPSLRIATTRPTRKEQKLGFRELVLIHRSLAAVRTLGLVERQDDLLDDTLQLVDVALEDAA